MREAFAIDRYLPLGAVEDRRAGSTGSPLIVGFCALAWVVLFAVAPALSRYGFLALSSFCALYLFWKDEPLYVSFTWWLYFLTPFLRRVVDYHAGFDPSSLMLVGPLFASAISCIELMRARRASIRSLPFVLGVLGVLYGLVVSAILGTPLAVSVQYFLAWMGPIAFGYLIFVRSPRYPEFRRALQRTFQWALLIVGTYGLFQYLYAPSWDRFWMENLSDAIASFGSPEPLGIRVFSTMNGPQPFALAVVLALLFTLYGESSFWQKAAWIAGYIGLLLSMARSAWLEWAIALPVLAVIARSRKMLSTSLIAGMLLVGMAVVAANLSIGQALADRFHTLDNVNADDSGQERRAGYETILDSAFASPFGGGWKVETQANDAMPIHDSSITEVVLSSGWFGLGTFYGSIALAVLLLLKDAHASQDKFIAVACSLLIALFVETLFNSLLGGSTGMGLWTCVGLGLAGSIHGRHAAVVS